MNILKEIASLPVHHQLALAAHILQTHKPGIANLAMAAGVNDQSVRGWLHIRSKK